MTSFILSSLVVTNISYTEKREVNRISVCVFHKYFVRVKIDVCVSVFVSLSICLSVRACVCLCAFVSLSVLPHQFLLGSELVPLPSHSRLQH